MQKKLYIEGTTDTDNGSLKIAFAKLLEKKFKGKMPRIVMGDGRSQTITKFCTAPMQPDEVCFLLIDSDKYPFDASKECSEFIEEIPNIVQECTIENTFFMIQEVESWLLSQPDVIKEKAKIIIPEHPISFLISLHKPSEKLQSYYQQQHRAYHKVSEFVKIFPYMDIDKLQKDYSDFERLLKALS